MYRANVISSHIQIKIILIIGAILVVLVGGFMSLSLGSTAVQVTHAAPCSGTDITGVTFRDYNENGIRNNREPGLGNVTITAYSDDGSTSSCQSLADGAYGINAPTGGFPVRLEYSLPTDGSLAVMQPAVAGGTTVQFFNAPAVNMDAGFNNPTQYCQNNPSLFTTCFVAYDNINSTTPTEPVSVATDYNANGTAPVKTLMTPVREMGTTYGVAWQANSGRLFTSSFVKTSAGLGPNGSGGTTTGGIYSVTPSGATMASASLFLDLNPIVNTGADPHPAPGDSCTSVLHDAGSTNENCWFHDGATFNQVGKLGLGDLDFNADATVLYTVNLQDRTLVEMPVGNPAVVPAPGDILTYPIPTNGCTNAADARPFALATQFVNPGSMFVGVTCTAESSGNRNELAALIYEFNRGTGPGTEVFTLIFTAPLNFNRPREVGNWGCTPNCPATWQPWQNTFQFVSQTGGGITKHIAISPQPWLTDIVFDGSDLIFALRDRVADQVPSQLGNPLDNTDDTTAESWAAGDMMRACTNGAGAWVLELNGGCGGVTGAGAGNTDGPGGGEYYLDVIYDPTPPNTYRHPELMIGGLAQIPGADSIAVTGYDFNTFNEGALGTWNHDTGVQLTGAQLFVGAGGPSFGKSNGLGDLEALCDAAPIEIGNRVWIDTNKDGIQDPNETPVPNVVLGLYNASGTLIATTTTNGIGHYVFNNGNVPGNMQPFTTYTVAVLDSNFAPAGPLDGYSPTLDNRNPDNLPSPQVRDSDGVLMTVGAGANLSSWGVTLTTGAPGFNNHTYDFGVILGPTAVSLTSFGAVVHEDGTVAVQWTTESELDNFGFELLRSATDVFATAESIYFESTVVGSGPGKTYNYTDRVPNEGVWHYWLVDVDTNGKKTVHGPVAVNVSGVSAVYTEFVFLPFVVR